MEIMDQAGWLWGLSLIVLTMAIHTSAVVMMAFRGAGDAGPTGNPRCQDVEPNRHAKFV